MRITRKFWSIRGVRWFAYCRDGRLLVMTREELEPQEIA